MNARARVAVVGSLNIDYIASVRRLPAVGQTVPATELLKRFGGKGANQAIAAARQGARVAMIGLVGDDDAGRAYRARLLREKIDPHGVGAQKNCLTGAALIAVDAGAENTIIVAPGANGKLEPATVRHHRKHIEQADVLLLQLEVPLPAVIEATRLANAVGVPVILNPSPMNDRFPWNRCQIDTAIVNDGEGHAIFGLCADDLARRLPAWRKAMARRHITRLIITRGAQSTLYVDASVYAEVPTLRVKPKDTVGAGDAFAGAFAARRAEGFDIMTAICYATCAGALTTLLPGAQEAIPTRRQTEAAFRKLPAAPAVI